MWSGTQVDTKILRSTVFLYKYERNPSRFCSFPQLFVLHNPSLLIFLCISLAFHRIKMSNQTHYCGVIEVVPNDKAVTKPSGPSTRNYELTNRSNNYDKSSGSYVRQTSKESYSSGDYSNRGKTGYKDEFKASSTVRVGDKGGYTEYYKQEKVTRVNYDSGSYSGGSKGYGGGKKSYNSNKYLY
ncbi:hypothetical protein RDABS01_012596 [Bienertia sinuspersici]